MILQQYYTREKRGIFRTTEGYDSIAKSKELKGNFIKKNLHNFCFYDEPRELAEAQEKNIDMYPKSLACFHIESGEMIIGQSVFVPIDFTGLRSTFFTHNYIISQEKSEDFVRNFRKILCAINFAESYDIEKGTEIPEIDDIPYEDSNEYMSNSEDIFIKLGINQEIFKKLLYAVFSSITGKKKVYISLNVDADKISKSAKELLKYTLYCLPYELRRNLGFITYIKEPESKKYINVLFVEKGSIKVGDSRVEKDYVFDFSQNRQLNLDIDVSNLPYLDFAWKNINSVNLQNFNNFVENLNPERKLDLDTYNELCTLWQILYVDFDFYKVANREAVLKSILYYMNTQNLELKEMLNELFLELFMVEKKDNGNNSAYFPRSGIIEAFIKYCDVSVEFVDDFISYITEIIFKGKNNGKDEYISELFKQINKYQVLFNKLVQRILTKSQFIKDVFREYLDGRFKKIVKFRDLLTEISFWGKNCPEVVKDDYFQKQTKKDLLRLLDNEKNFIFCCKQVHDDLDRFLSQCPERNELEIYKRYVNELINAVDLLVLENIDFEGITQEELERLDLKSEKVINNEKFEAIMWLKRLLHENGDFMPEQFKGLLVKMDINYANVVKQLIRKFFEKNIISSNYDKIILGFRRIPSREDTWKTDDGSYEFSAMLIYIEKKDKKEVYKFLSWAYKNKIFEHYAQIFNKAVYDYLNNCDKELFKIIKKSLNKADKGLGKVLKKVEYQNASSFKKFLIKNGDILLKTSFIGLGVGIVVFAVIIFVIPLIMGK
ncbi:MAG: GAP1-N2 domain-containing protein [Ruminiclostridium sp.]